MPESSRRYDLPSQPELNVGTTGHVDHGKTTLVEAITGIWTSAHSEELKRGITIKVGYADAAFYKCESCPPPDCYTNSPKCPSCGTEAKLIRVVSFVDCPGHESLMANMLSGAAVMDGALLVIAANEKVPQPQTREHLFALKMLEMKHIIVIQNKVDLVSDDEARANYRDIKSFINQTLSSDLPIIPISAQRRLNIDAVIGMIVEYIPVPKRDPNAKPLMQILRSFDVNRPGTSIDALKGGVVGGTLIQGVLRVDDEIELRPGILNPNTSKYEPLQTKILSLVTSAGFMDQVKPGGLVAVGTMLDPALTKSDSLIGSVLGRPGELPDTLYSFSMDTKLFEAAIGTQELVKVEKIKVGEALRLNVGTAVTLGTVSSVREDTVEVKLRHPVCASEGSRAAISRRIGDRWRLIGLGILR
ncbi:MAG: translation initiation factor IF-2 subunit gamma [Nitrososphaerota archaeon]|nr:translation initiation factor IF-2 subunit gamma [Nitrososphaerota archaeon]